MAVLLDNRDDTDIKTYFVGTEFKINDRKSLQLALTERWVLRALTASLNILI